MDFIIGIGLCLAFLFFILLINYLIPSDDHKATSFDKMLNKFFGWLFSTARNILNFYVDVNHNAYYGTNFQLSLMWFTTHISSFYLIWLLSPPNHRNLYLFLLIPSSLILSAVLAHLKKEAIK